MRLVIDFVASLETHGRPLKSAVAQGRLDWRAVTVCSVYQLAKLLLFSLIVIDLSCAWLDYLQVGNAGCAGCVNWLTLAHNFAPACWDGAVCSFAGSSLIQLTWMKSIRIMGWKDSLRGNLLHFLRRIVELFAHFANTPSSCQIWTDKIKSTLPTW